jgi:hypothetical protein
MKSYRNILGSLVLLGATSLAVPAALAEDGAAKLSHSPDGWIVKSEASEFSEGRIVVALKIDKDLITGLGLRCTDHVKQVTLRHFDAAFEAGKKYPVSLRVAKGAIESYSGIATNNRTLLIDDGEKFIGSVMGAKKIALRLETGPQLFEEVKFESDDMREALKLFLDECPVK